MGAGAKRGSMDQREGEGGDEMNREEKQAWLDGLEVGSRVVIQSHRFKSITRIEKITKTRRFSTSNGQRFNSDGSQYGKSSWDFYELEPVTEEVVIEIKKRKLVSKMNNVKWGEVNYQKLKVISEILGEDQ